MRGAEIERQEPSRLLPWRRTAVRLATAVTVVATSLLAVGPAAADRSVPPGCEVDLARNGNGTSTVSLVADGSEPLELDIDDRHRIVVLSVVADGPAIDPTYSHRVRRYRPDGTLDESFGNGGVAVLPGDTKLAGNTSISVGDDGQIWVTRGDELGTVEILALDDAGQLRLGSGEVVLGDRTGQMIVGAFTEIEGGNGFAVAAVQIGLHLEVVTLTSAGEVIASVETSDLNAFAVDVLEIDLDAGLLVGSVLDRDQGRWYPLIFAYDEQPEPVINYSRSGAYASVSAPTFGSAQVFGWLNDEDDERHPLARELTFDPWRNLTATVDVDVAPTQVHEAGIVALPNGTVVTQVEDFDRTVAGLAWGRIDDPNVGDIPHGLVDEFTPWAVRDANPREPVVVAGFGAERASVVVLQMTPTTLGDAPASTSLRDQVRRQYLTVYGRTPDAASVDYWMGQRAIGVSTTAMATALISAPEFADGSALTTSEFVALLHENATGRVDDVAVAFLASLIDDGDMTRAEMVAFISDGEELVRNSFSTGVHTSEEGSAHRLYRAYFSRNPDELGLCYWSRLLTGDETLRDVSDFFAASDEFDALYGDLTDRQFVELVYRNVLGRPGEPDGVEFWSAELWSGRRTRGEVMIGFSESPEFILLTGTLPPG